jgi:hypothetical protein
MPSAATSQVVWLCERCESGADGSLYYGSIAKDGICAWCGSLAVMVFDKTVMEPRRAPLRRFRPATFSTSLEIERSPTIIWDQARYYADLGVDPRADKRTIMRAYMARCAEPGTDTRRLTYIVKQLLKPEVRERYDNCPPWSLWFDKYVMASVLAKINRDLAERAAMDPSEWEEAEKIDLSGYLDKPFQVTLDDDSLDGHDDAPHWGWGYYLQQSKCRDTTRLARWQEHLVRALGERKERRTLAVGFLGSHMECPWEVQVVGNQVVVFLNESEQPSAALAREAADRVVTTT